jgi:D-proline reductase (dithiol) PrdB
MPEFVDTGILSAMNQDTSVRYMERSRRYYAAHGYEIPYEWAHYDAIPFTPLAKRLSDSTVTVVTTAMPDATYTKAKRRFAVGDLRNPPASLFTGELAWDDKATHTNDRESYLPIRELNRLLDDGSIGALAPHYYCLPTTYSRRVTIEVDAPIIVNACRENAVDVALLIPL